MKSILNRITTTVMEQIPNALSPDNQYAKSMAAVLCLLVSADREFDTKEFDDASQFIEADTKLRAEGLTQRTINYFTLYCNRIKETMKPDDITFSTMQTELVAEARACEEPYNMMLKEHIEVLKNTCVNPCEVAVLDRIKL